jgi:hypothetical protein
VDSAASVSDPLADDKVLTVGLLELLTLDCVFVLKTLKFGGEFLMYCCYFVLMAEQKAWDGINVQ